MKFRPALFISSVLAGAWNATYSVTALVQKVVFDLFPRLPLGDRSSTGYGHSPRTKEGGKPYTFWAAPPVSSKLIPKRGFCPNSLTGLKRVNLLSRPDQVCLTTLRTTRS